ncbi:MAG TPA: hypothetical protein DCE41_15865 [Cytophagales bacterium]|nr:hypothetical protein [Cytophagales bacterium]HAA23362.1 hypothetical protein [Cytophagales bacterium]HAP63675.1 hypothetical protein [Cytophagales bacterium]
MGKHTPQLFQTWLAEFTEKTGVGIEHGDYKRIADLSPKPDDKGVYTADYVRKVLLDIRDNREILSRAKAYLQQKAKLIKALRKGQKP